MSVIATNSNNIKVKKRSGDIVEFDPIKIYNAIYGAFKEHLGHDPTNGSVSAINSVKVAVVNIINGRVNGKPIDIEFIQDTVETQLMSQGYYDVARLYILYRDKRRTLREQRLRPDSKAFADYITLIKYSRYDEKLGRRELFNEIIDRIVKMHKSKYPQLSDKIDQAFSFVYNKQVLPSMRSMQYAGKAIETNNARMYNCCASLCNRPRFFQEAFWLLLSGVGVGYSIQYDHIEQLPPIALEINADRVKHHVIADSIEGWSDAVGV
ncbi:MAG: ATP cone domain-containing protein [Candidatus Heimdallarchaeaceae archaeon]